MRIAVLILGVLGGLCSGALGAKWLSDYYERREDIETARKLLGGALSDEFAELDRRVRAGWCLVAAALLGIVGGIVAVTGQGKIAATMLLLGAMVPAVFAIETLIATFLLAVGAAFSFLLAEPAPARPRFRRPLAVRR